MGKARIHIDINFDTRTDARPGTDVDATSINLRKYHQQLWSKPLPSGVVFELVQEGSRSYLTHRSKLGTFELSSDFFASKHRAVTKLWEQIPADELEHMDRQSRTIGGYIPFPARRVDGKQTINMRRATHHLVRDRFDLTLECIRRFYAGEPSPLTDTFAKYETFFALFETFTGYTEHFLLQDALDLAGNVAYFSLFDDFATNPLPRTVDEYVAYRQNVLAFVKARNLRIAQVANGGLTAEDEAEFGRIWG